jgi:hypothetical protein
LLWILLCLQFLVLAQDCSRQSPSLLWNWDQVLDKEQVLALELVQEGME